MLLCTSFLEDPPTILDTISWYMHVVFDPPSTFDGSYRAEWAWHMPFSFWLEVGVIGIIHAIPNHVAELVDGLFDNDQNGHQDWGDEEDLYVLL